MSFLETKRDFDVIYDEYTANRQFLAIDMASIEKNWDERLFVGTPDPDAVTPMKLGCAQYWTELSDK